MNVELLVLKAHIYIQTFLSLWTIFGILTKHGEHSNKMATAGGRSSLQMIATSYLQSHSVDSCGMTVASAKATL